MRAAFFGVDVVCKSKNRVRITVVVLHCDFYLAVNVFFVEIDDFGEDGFLGLVHFLNERHYAAFIAEHLSALGLDSLIGKLDDKPLVKICKLAQSRLHRFVVEVERFKYLCVGIERDGRAGVRCVADDGKRSFCNSAIETYAIKLSVLSDFGNKPFAERVDAGHAHAVQTARNLVAAASELSARVELCEHHFHCGFAFFFDYAGRNTASVVRDANRAVFEYLDDDVRAISRKRFVNGVVHDFRHQMVKSADVRRADVHARAFSDGIESFENLNITRVVTVFDFF